MSFVLSLLLIQGLLGAIPPAKAASPAEPRKVAVPTLAAPAKAPRPLAQSERRPVLPAAGATLGLASVTTAAPALTQTGTVEAITSTLKRAPASSGSNFDAYADPATGQQHLAVVHGTDVNQMAGGSWQAADGPLVSSPDGYSAPRAGEARVTFPKAISESDPVLFEVADGTLSVVPSGIDRTVGEVSAGAVTYPNALPATDIVETLAPGGFKERLVLASSSAPTTFSWDVSVEGLTLDSSAGDIAILAKGKPVARIPVAVIVDAKGKSVTQPLVLSGDTLSLSIDPAFLAKAKYPIVVDPGASTLSASRDTYTDASTPSTSYETTYNVFTKASGPIKHAWMLFDTSSFTNSSRLVYSADLKLKHVSGSSTSTVHARQVTSAWPATLTYSNAPSVAGSIAASQAGSNGGTWTWSLGALYQNYIEGSAPDYGVRLEATSGQSQFNSKEQGTPANRPDLVLSYNDLPGVPTATTPEGTVTTDAPVLSAGALPSDPNGDSVLLRYEIAECPLDNCASANFASPVWVSNYQSATSATVAAGKLLDGKTYAWRVVARDVCTAPSTLCSLTDAAGITHGAPTSAPKTIQVTSTSLGRDDRYEMWRHDLGSNMSGAVNLANGNLNLDVPFDTLSTDLGDLRYGIVHNSLSTVNAGLGNGWRLYATPEGMDVPVSLEYRSATNSVRSTTSTGQQFTFVGAGNGLFLGQGNGAAAGTVTKNLTSGNYSFIPADGGKVTFNSSGLPTTVRTPETLPEAGASGAVFSYAYDASGHLTSVTDPDSRTITFTWTGGALDKVTRQDAKVFEVTQASGSISVVDPTGRSIGIVRDSSTSRPTEIRDGEVVADAATGWVVSYSGDGSVSQITAPPGGGAATSPAPWVFTRSGPYFGSNASVGYVTDPRGSYPTTFTRQVDFNTDGYPIRVAGPADQNGYWPVEVQVFDTNGNLVCARSSGANVIDPKTPSTCESDERSTTYDYESYAPFRLTHIYEGIHAASGTQPEQDQDYLSEPYWVR